MPSPFFLSFLFAFMRKKLPGLSSFKTQDWFWKLSVDSVPVISITPLWTFETVIPYEHIAWRCPQAEGHRANRSRNEYKRIENILKSKTSVALFRQRLIFSVVLRANKRPDKCFYALLILNTTLWKDKSLVIIGCCLVLNNLFDEYSASRYSGFSLWLNSRKVRKILFSLGEAKSSSSDSRK